MKKENVCILIVMLFVSSAIFPITNAFEINTNIENNKKEPLLNERAQVWVSIPDVHIYSEKLFLNWGSVEFNEPGKVIDVDLSEINGDKFDLGISQNVICHFKNQFIPLILIYTIEGWSMSTQPYWSDMNSQHIVTSAWLLLDKEDSIYPINVWVTAAPFILVGYLSYYWFLHMLKPELPMCPSEFELKYGTTAQYQLNLIT
jgi:hypothetical protein